MEQNKNIEFVDARVEKEEIRGFSLKGILNGNILGNVAVTKQIPFILFLVFLATIYIANRFHAEKVVRELTSMREEVKDLRAEQLTTASKLMNLSRPSKVQELVNEKGLGLKEPNKPPYKIVVDR